MYALHVVFKFLLRFKPHVRPTKLASISVLFFFLRSGGLIRVFPDAIIFTLFRFNRIHHRFLFWP